MEDQLLTTEDRPQTTIDHRHRITEGPQQTMADLIMEDLRLITEDLRLITEDRLQTTEDRARTMEDLLLITEDQPQITEDHPQTTQGLARTTEDQSLRLQTTDGQLLRITVVQDKTQDQITFGRAPTTDDQVKTMAPAVDLTVQITEDLHILTTHHLQAARPVDPIPSTKDQEEGAVPADQEVEDMGVLVDPGAVATSNTEADTLTATEGTNRGNHSTGIRDTQE